MIPFKKSGVLLCCLIFLIQGCYTGYYNPPTKLETLSNTSCNWQHDSTAHFDYYYELNSPSAVYVDTAKIYFEKMFSELLSFLGVNNYGSKLNLFMVGSRKRMKEILSWQETNGIAKTEDNTVYSVFNKDINTFGKHEFCHVICFNSFGGRCKEIWINEGLAVASDDRWWGFDLYSLSNYLITKKKLIPIRDLMDDFHSYNSLISYPECGSFVKYIKEKYGLDLIRDIWAEGAKALGDKLNKKVESIESEWLGEIKKHDYKDINYEERIFASYGNQFKL